MLDPGQRNTYMQFEQFNDELDATTNEPLTNDDANWLPFCEEWVKVETLSGREYFQANQTQANVTHKVTVLSNERTRRLTEDMRGRYSTPQGVGRKLDIVSITDGTDFDELVLMCMEKKSA